MPHAARLRPHPCSSVLPRGPHSARLPANAAACSAHSRAAGSAHPQPRAPLCCLLRPARRWLRPPAGSAHPQPRAPLCCLLRPARSCASDAAGEARGGGEAVPLRTCALDAAGEVRGGGEAVPLRTGRQSRACPVTAPAQAARVGRRASRSARRPPLPPCSPTTRADPAWCGRVRGRRMAASGGAEPDPCRGPSRGGRRGARQPLAGGREERCALAARWRWGGGGAPAARRWCGGSGKEGASVANGGGGVVRGGENGFFLYIFMLLDGLWT
ncbi:hypothetical protein PVAP13_5NG006608 [Panicum virgatum]|uniref:Uncharacterized protein n=1 Tax=Panicum virgatum TaxID=38727 RepID=A0A8T0RIT6_PANVG|nr:hypothetical protein PVAP13_5NG006608 [Panicum virgatum]